MANAVDLVKKSFFVISGASRGIGRSMAIECAAKMSSGSVIVLIARSVAGLEVTKAQILAKNQTNVTVYLFGIDLTRPTAAQIANIFDTALYERNVGDFELAMIIHNIGTVGDVSKWAKALGDANAIDVWNDYYSINVFSVAALNTAFLNLFEQHSGIRRLVVNVTSKAALVPFKSFALYCSGKAAREMYFRVLATEEADNDRNLTVLNYAPGPVQTEMTADVEARSVAESTREMFFDLRTKQTILQPIETTLKFVQIIEMGAYESGAHIDYYDA